MWKPVLPEMGRVVGLRVCVLASGSSGNCIYVGSEHTGLLIDAGVSCKVTMERLLASGLDPQRIDGICVTHEHDDHKASLAVLHRRMGVQLFGNADTVKALEGSAKTAGLAWQIFTTGWPLKQRIGGRQGHLSNLKSGDLLCEVASDRLHTVFLAHISRDCNRPALAKHTVGEALRRRGLTHINLLLTYADRASDVVEA